MSRFTQVAAIAFAGVSLIAFAPPCHGQANTRSVRAAPIQSAEETRDLIKALRSIEGRTASGMNYREMCREMGDLTIAVKAFEELLERRKEAKLLQQVEEVITPYKQAQNFWEWCLNADECYYGSINVNGDHEGARFVRRILEQYPSLNAQEKDGGVFSDHPQAGPGTVFRSDLVGALWDIGGRRSKALRNTLHR